MFILNPGGSPKKYLHGKLHDTFTDSVFLHRLLIWRFSRTPKTQFHRKT